MAAPREGHRRMKPRISHTYTEELPQTIWLFFGGRADQPWLYPLKRGFRHCFAAIQDAQGWTVLDPLSGRLIVAHLPLDPGFPVAPETDANSFPGGSLVFLQPYGGGVFTPFEFFKATNDFRGDASTPASRSAYGMPQYQYQADKTNYAPPESASVVNAFALDPDVSRTPQQVFDDSIAAQFLAFNPSTKPSRGSRAPFAPVGTAQINGDYASPVYFSDWENPRLCTSLLSSYGFSQTPATNP